MESTKNWLKYCIALKAAIFADSATFLVPTNLLDIILVDSLSRKLDT